VNEDMPIALALREGARWLRSQTATELATVYEKRRNEAAHARGAPYEQMSEIWRHFVFDIEEHDRVSAPCLLGAFTVTGA
jgi:hypothetical protein